MSIKRLLRGNNVITSSGWSAAYTNPPNIATDYPGWIAWKNNRIAQFEYHCPSSRATTYYFAQSGNDSTGDGSIGNPYQTISKAATLLAASSGNIRLRFNRGDTWRETSTLDTSKNNVTIDSYGSGAKPLFLRSTITYPQASAWTDNGDNTFSRSEANAIAWVLRSDDRLGESHGTHLSRQNSQVNCAANEESWYWNSGTNTLYVNLSGGDEPSNFNLEAVPSNTTVGVGFSGDGCRVEDIMTIGYGMSTGTTSTQVQGIQSTATGTNANYFKNCEAYYGSSHAIAHYVGGSSGGKAMFYGCSAGLCNYNASSETIFNTYSNTGGQETWFISCTPQYGTLKSNDWTYATTYKRGLGFYGHTSGGSNYSDLIVKFGCTIPSASYSQPATISNHANSPPGTGTITDVRYFFVNSSFNENADPGAGGFDFTSNAVIYGNQFIMKRIVLANANGWANDSPQYCWWINNYCNINMTNLTTTGFYLYNAPGVAKTNDNKIYFWHNLFRFNTTTGMTSGGAGIDNDSANDTDAAPSATADDRNGEFKNNILCYETAKAGLQCAFNNYATKQKNNAYYNVAQFSNQTRGYNLDPAPQTPGSFPSLNVSQSQYLLHGTTDVVVSHDINGKRRTVSPPDIGPVDFSS